jgi:energy-coupling factor transport system ATP-binding protein
MPADGGALLELRGWTLAQRRGHGTEPLLRGLDLTLHAGAWLAIAGPNGSGKSSLLSFLAGPDSPLRVPTALLPQDPDDQFVAATVAAELALGHGGPVPPPPGFGLESLLDANPRLLSAGQKQRLALAVALGTRPKVLLCDEPTSLQDERQAAWVLDELDAWRRRTGGCVVTATCDRREALRADELLALGEGGVRAQGPVATVLAAGACDDAFGGDEAGMDGTPPALPARVPGSGRVVLALRGVECRFGNGGGFGPVDLELAAGARLGICGPNGCGKSTLLAACAGARRPDRGEVALGSRRLYARSALDTRHGLAMLSPQFPEYLFSRTTVAAEIAVDPGLADQPAGAFLAGLGLPADAAGRHPRDLSSGQRRRLALALALRSRRPLVLVDEPTVGLDGPGRRLARALLEEAPRDAAVVVASHDHRFLAALGCEVRRLGPCGLDPAAQR